MNNSEYVKAIQYTVFVYIRDELFVWSKPETGTPFLFSDRLGQDELC